MDECEVPFFTRSSLSEPLAAMATSLFDPTRQLDWEERRGSLKCIWGFLAATDAGIGAETPRKAQTSEDFIGNLERMESTNENGRSLETVCFILFWLWDHGSWIDVKVVVFAFWIPLGYTRFFSDTIMLHIIPINPTHTHIYILHTYRL